MRTYKTICDVCGEDIFDERRVWILKCPPDYKGIDYDLCFDCVDKVMKLSDSGSLVDMAQRMAGVESAGK